MRVRKIFRKSSIYLLILALPANVAIAQGHRHSKSYHRTQQGVASYYSNSFNGQLTSTGDVFTNKGMTAASNTLPLGTYVKVTNLRNHKWVVVKVNDRMNKHNKRTIDLTRTAAKRLGMIYRGITQVKVEVIPAAFYSFFHVTPEELIAYGGGRNSINSGS